MGCRAYGPMIIYTYIYIYIHTHTYILYRPIGLNNYRPANKAATRDYILNGAQPTVKQSSYTGDKVTQLLVKVPTNIGNCNKYRTPSVVRFPTIKRLRIE